MTFPFKKPKCNNRLGNSKLCYPKRVAIGFELTARASVLCAGLAGFLPGRAKAGLPGENSL
jgi:hypothetical protein